MCGDLSRNWRAAWIAAALILMPSLGAVAETGVFKVLVAPGEGVPNGAFAHADGLVATLDNQPYAVRSVEPLRPGGGRTVIVLDMGSTSWRNHACLLAEAFGAMERTRESPAPVLLIGGDSRYRYRVDLGRGRTLDLYTGGDLQTLIHQCESGNNPDERHSLPGAPWSATDVDAGPSFPLKSLLHAYGKQDVPVRVFWLSESFEDLTWWTVMNCDDYGTNCIPPYPDIEGVAEANLTIFPLAFRKRERQSRTEWRRVINGADKAAHATGGFVSVVSGKPGDTLVQAMEQSRAGVMISLEGPVTADGRRPAKAQTLRIQGGASGNRVKWERRYVVNTEGSVKADPSELVPTVVPARLGLGSGCRAAEPSGGERTLSLTFPPQVVTAPSGKVDVYVYYPEEAGLARQRNTLTRVQGHAEGLCLPLMHVRDGMRFLVVVMDRETGWVGAKEGQLSASNPER